MYILKVERIKKNRHKGVGKCDSFRNLCDLLIIQDKLLFSYFRKELGRVQGGQGYKDRVC